MSEGRYDEYASDVFMVYTTEEEEVSVIPAARWPIALSAAVVGTPQDEQVGPFRSFQCQHRRPVHRIGHCRRPCDSSDAVVVAVAVGLEERRVDGEIR